MDFMNTPISWLSWTGLHMSPWKLIGIVGALMFGGRWVVQFLASRKQGRPVVPRLFWYMSLLGSSMTLSYFTLSRKQDAVGVLQNVLPALTAAYSLYLDIKHHGWAADRASRLRRVWSRLAGHRGRNRAELADRIRHSATRSTV